MHQAIGLTHRLGNDCGHGSFLPYVCVEKFQVLLVYG